MTMVKNISVLLALMLMLALPALAASSTGSPEFNSNLLTVREFNKIKPLQNPEYERGTRVLERRVLDSKNKVVGSVDDIVLAPNGSIESLKIDFDRLRLNTAVYVNFRTLRVNSVTRGYQLSFNENEITDIYPGLLADIATAAGDEGDLSTARIKDTIVMSENGRRIGTVSDVLFSSSGNRAQALYIEMVGSSMNETGVAIPFRTGTFREQGAKMTLVVPDVMADAMINFAGNK
jgi:sporulation protein YlmC with PRC-barrel domain